MTTNRIFPQFTPDHTKGEAAFGWFWLLVHMFVLPLLFAVVMPEASAEDPLTVNYVYYGVSTAAVMLVFLKLLRREFDHLLDRFFRCVGGIFISDFLWYALSKIAVPVFVMVSGACLLGREDTYRKCFGRFLRIVGTLVVFSAVYFIANTGSLNPGAFLKAVWTEGITDSFWYLYFYAGLMLMLPLFQRLSANMRGHDALYLIGLCFGLDAFWPLVVHYMPAL